MKISVFIPGLLAAVVAMLGRARGDPAVMDTSSLIAEDGKGSSSGCFRNENSSISNNINDNDSYPRIATKVFPHFQYTTLGSGVALGRAMDAVGTMLRHERGDLAMQDAKAFHVEDVMGNNEKRIAKVLPHVQHTTQLNEHVAVGADDAAGRVMDAHNDEADVRLVIAHRTTIEKAVKLNVETKLVLAIARMVKTVATTLTDIGKFLVNVSCGIIREAFPWNAPRLNAGCQASEHVEELVADYPPGASLCRRIRTVLSGLLRASVGDGTSLELV